MFKKSIALQQHIVDLEMIVEQQREVINVLRMRNTLINIERNGRYNLFTFSVDGGKTVIVETMGLLSDDITDWKRSLGI